MRNKNFAFLFFILTSFPGFTQRTNFTIHDTLRGTNSKERACYDVTYYDLFLSIDIPTKRITGSNKIYFTVVDTSSILQIDLAANLSIQKITNQKDEKVSFSRKGNAVFVSFDRPLQLNQKTNITVYYSGNPQIAIEPPWDGGFVWSTDSLNKPWVGVACEGIGASIWWPCKDLPADEPDSMRMNYEVSTDLFCAANGKLRSKTKTERNTIVYEWFVQYPINTYNVTLNIGDYTIQSDVFRSNVGQDFSVTYYVLSYNKEIAQKHFTQVKTILNRYEKLFGPYPFPKDGYALIETAYWGMEHQSGISYGNKYVNNMIQKLDYIIVHETGHEWWGNSISTADHAQMWIHESFTTYGESLLLESLYRKEVALAYLIGQKKSIKNDEPILGPLGVNYHYWKDTDMYYKGAWILNTLRSSIDNDSLWFALFPAIQKEFAYQQITTDRLVDFISNFLKQECKKFFAIYLGNAEIPVLEYETVKINKNQYALKYRWESSMGGLYLPIKLKLRGQEAIKLIPSTIYQSVTLKREEIKANKFFDENAYYVNFKQIRLK